MKANQFKFRKVKLAVRNTNGIECYSTCSEIAGVQFSVIAPSREQLSTALVLLGIIGHDPQRFQHVNIVPAKDVRTA